MAKKELKFEVLNDLRDVLVKDLQPEKHFSFLRSKRILDEEDCEEIKAKTTRRKQAEQFLDILCMKGENGFDYFCESFVHCGKTQLHLLNEILDAYEDKIEENQVEPTRNYQEFISLESLSEHLPRPGEPGAPHLPGHFHSNFLPSFTNGSSSSDGSLYGLYDSPPPYSSR